MSTSFRTTPASGVSRVSERRGERIMNAPRKICPALGMMFLLFALAGTGCAGTLKGQVVDAQTGTPIAGAVILGVWMKYVGPPGLEHAPRAVGRVLTVHPYSGRPLGPSTS